MVSGIFPLTTLLNTYTLCFRIQHDLKWRSHVSIYQLGWPLHEGDDFHPQENIEKMAHGEPLTDQVSLGVCVHMRVCPWRCLVSSHWLSVIYKVSHFTSVMSQSLSPTCSCRELNKCDNEALHESRRGGTKENGAKTKFNWRNLFSFCTICIFPWPGWLQQWREYFKQLSGCLPTSSLHTCRQSGSSLLVAVFGGWR